MKHLKDIDRYIDRLDNQKVIKGDTEILEWTERDYALNLLIRAGQLVKFMALPHTPKLIKKKQI